MEFSRHEYWSGLPFPSSGNLPNPGIEPRSPALRADYFFTIWATREVGGLKPGTLKVFSWYPRRTAYINTFMAGYVCVCESRSVMSDSLQLTDYTVHGILQARILEWVAVPFSRGSCQPRGSSPGLPRCRQILYQLSYYMVGSNWKTLFCVCMWYATKKYFIYAFLFNIK